MEYIKTDRAPAAIGPYSQAICEGNLIFTSGQIPLDPLTGEVVGAGIAEQTERALKNLLAVLEQANSDASHVLKTTCFLADIADFAQFNKVYAEYLPCAPARSCFAVKDLPRGVLVEIEAVAVKK